MTPHCLIVTSEYPPYTVGGIGRYVAELATRLLRRQRVSVLLVPTYARFGGHAASPSATLSPCTEAAPEVVMADGAYQAALATADGATGLQAVEDVSRRLAHGIVDRDRSSAPTHLYVQDYALSPLAAAMQALQPSLRVFAACHLPVYAGFTYFDKPVGDAIHQVLEARLLHLAERIVVPSTFAAHVLGITHNVTPDQLVVLPLGVARSAPVVAPPAGPLRLLAIGRATEQKGYHFLFEVLRRLLRRDAGVRLTVLTGTDDDARLVALAAAHGVAAHVDVAPAVAPAAIWPLIDRHHLLVTTSLYETFGLAVLEAMASARPAIGFSVGALPELWGAELGAEFGTPVADVFALADRISSLADDRDRAQRLGQMALRRAQAFSWERHVAALARCLDTPMPDSGGPPWP